MRLFFSFTFCDWFNYDQIGKNKIENKSKEVNSNHMKEKTFDTGLDA